METNILVFGDSIAWGAWDRKMGGRVNRLRLYLDELSIYDTNNFSLVYNLGISGDTSEGLIKRFDEEIQNRNDLKNNLIIIIAIGVNDTLWKIDENRIFIDFNKFKNNIETLIEKAKKYTQNLIFMGLIPVEEAKTNPIPRVPNLAYKNYLINQYNEAIKNICSSRELDFIDIYKVFENHFELLEEGDHPNEKGHELIFNQVKIVLDKYLGMDLKSFMLGYTFDKIIEIEQQDLQFIALKNAWEKISKLNFSKQELISRFLYMILQSALVCYQLSGKGEDWWQEFAQNLDEYFKNLNQADNLTWRKSILSKCKNNCRLNEIKINRLLKFSKMSKTFLDYSKLQFYYENMEQLNIDLAEIMAQNKDDKTIVLAVKMFGYGARIVWEKFIEYPFEINIPIDSRLEKIFVAQTGKSVFKKSEIKKYFLDISKEYKIPPLHLDALLWIEYWNKISV